MLRCSPALPRVHQQCSCNPLPAYACAHTCSDWYGRSALQLQLHLWRLVRGEQRSRVFGFQVDNLWVLRQKLLLAGSRDGHCAVVFLLLARACHGLKPDTGTCGANSHVLSSVCGCHEALSTSRGLCSIVLAQLMHGIECAAWRTVQFLGAVANTCAAGHAPGGRSMLRVIRFTSPCHATCSTCKRMRTKALHESPEFGPALFHQMKIDDGLGNLHACNLQVSCRATARTRSRARARMRLASWLMDITFDI